jgi:capsular polysaccharide biosynthesis protein
VEIVDYLRIARRRLWVLVGIPLAAAIITTLFVFLSPAQYTATATVSAPALVGGQPGNQFSGSQAVGQFASAFQSVAQGPAIRQSVSAATGVTLGKIQGGLTVSQVGASSTMQLTYQSTERKEIVPVLTAITKQTLDNLFSSQVTLAQQQITDAKADLTKADQTIVAWEQTNKVVDPPQIFQSMVDHLNTLRSQQSALQANGKPSGSAALSAQIASTQASMTKFAPLLAEYDVLASARDSASASINTAQNNLVTARSQLNAADPSKVAFISGEHTVNDGSAIATKVLPVTGAAIFAAVALIAILELLASGRVAARSAEQRQEEAAEADRARAAAPTDEADNDSDADEADEVDSAPEVVADEAEGADQPAQVTVADEPADEPVDEPVAVDEPAEAAEETPGDLADSRTEVVDEADLEDLDDEDDEDDEESDEDDADGATSTKDDSFAYLLK